MKKLLVIALLVCSVHAVNKINIPYIFQSGTPAKASEVNANIDSIKTPVNKLIDTVNYSIPRWKVFSDKDSTFKWMNIDTIPSADTINAKKAKVTVLNVDTVIGSPRINYITGTTKTDSVHSAGGINAPRIRVDDIYLNDIKIAKYSTFPCSLSGVSGIETLNAYYCTIGDVVVVCVPFKAATSDSAGFALYGIPASLQTDLAITQEIRCYDNGSPVSSSYIDLQGEKWVINKPSGAWTASGAKGFDGFTVVYVKR